MVDGKEVNKISVAKNNIIEQWEGSKLVKRIDLTEVNKIINKLEDILLHRKNTQDRNHIEYQTKIMEKVNRLNKDQLKYFITNLWGLLDRYADLYQSAIDNPKKFKEDLDRYNLLTKS